MLKQPLVTEKRHIGAKVFLKSHLENVQFTISRDPYLIEFLSYPRINMHPVKPYIYFHFPFKNITFLHYGSKVVKLGQNRSKSIVKIDFFIAFEKNINFLNRFITT